MRLRFGNCPGWPGAPGGYSLTTTPRCAICSINAALPGGNAMSMPVPSTATVGASDVERAAMRRGVDARRHAAHHAPARAREGPRESACVIEAVGRCGAAADDGDRRMPQARDVAAHVQQRRRIGQATQQGGIVGIVDRQALVHRTSVCRKRRRRPRAPSRCERQGILIYSSLIRLTASRPDA